MDVIERQAENLRQAALLDGRLPSRELELLAMSVVTACQALRSIHRFIEAVPADDEAAGAARHESERIEAVLRDHVARLNVPASDLIDLLDGGPPQGAAEAIGRALTGQSAATSR